LYGSQREREREGGRERERGRATYFLYKFRLMVVITETKCVYCLVRTESLNVFVAVLALYRVNIHLIEMGMLF
jgi:hypothetical protein